MRTFRSMRFGLGRTALAKAIGNENAILELKWMKQALLKGIPRIPATAPKPTLASMIQRRIGGEPLQYILGMSGF